MYKSFLLYLLFSALLLPYARGQVIDEWMPIGSKVLYHSGHIAEIIGDTLIEGKLCRIKKLTPYVTYHPEVTYWHINNKRVYRYVERAFHLMYDFNLKVGDTLKPYADPFWVQTYGQPYYILKEIAETQIGNTRVKQQVLVDGNELGVWGAFFPTEYLGQSGFEYYPDGMVLIYPGDFYQCCYSPDGETFYRFAYYLGECTINSNALENEVLKVPELSFFPNPFTEQLTVQNSGTAALALQIWDMNGKQVYAAGELMPGSHTLHLNLPRGMYYLRGMSASGTTTKILYRE